MNLFRSNPQLNNTIKRIRNKRRLQDALAENNINVQTTEEKESSDVEKQTSGLGIENVQVSNISQSIVDAEEMMDIAGVGKGQTVGEVARDIGKQNRQFADPFAEAVTSLGGREGIAAKAGLATYGAFKAGEMGLAKGLYGATQMLSGPAGMVLNVIGPTEMYGDVPVAMGSGAFGQISDKVMGMHYDVAAKMNAGIAGYNQGVINGQVISLSPGFFGGQVLTGNIPPGLTAGEFSDLMDRREERALELEEMGVDTSKGLGIVDQFTSPQAAMEQGGISVDSFGSATEAAKAGIGYSSYDAQGNPTGAAPPGSAFSSTGKFSSAGGYDENNDNGGNTGGSDPSSDMGLSTAYGGKINMQMGGDPAQQQTPTGEMGFVGGPPDQFTEQQTIADDIPKTVPEGAFVINAPAVEFAGKEDIKQMLIEAYEIVAQKDIDAGVDKSPTATTIPSKEQVDIMISRGEVIVPPEIAKIIGYDRLEKINNRGKKEVARRQEESQKEEKPQAKTVAKGGSVGMQEGGISSGFIDYDALERKYGTRNIDQVIQKATADIFGVREQGEKAQEIAYNFARENEFIDDDKSEDTLRHILGGGFMANEKLGFAMYNLKENPYVNMIYGGFKGQGFTLPTGEAKQEAEIDLNNNEFGKALRQKYPNEKDFIEQAKGYLMDLRAGKEVKPVNGFRPMMSLGTIQREN